MDITQHILPNGQRTAFPTEAEIAALKVGSIVTDCFGRETEIVEITANYYTYEKRRAMSCYVNFGVRSRCTLTLIADTLGLEVGLRYDSEQLMRLQRQARLARKVQL